LCAAFIAEDSPNGSEDLDSSSDSGDSGLPVFSNALLDAAKAKTDQVAHVKLPVFEPTTASLRDQKREAIRQAVEAQRAELECNKH
jgi:hypothetical protein